jgi:pimeloyl-ACP methyl ester carboxylesterase
VIAMTNRLGAETFHLVGHDWGGVVAWRLAGNSPSG